jgi:hypothetical protein
MPFAKVTFDKEKVGEADLLRLGILLSQVIAKHLGVPGTIAELSPDEIEVEFSSFGPFDRHSKDVRIIIWANEHPERAANLDERRQAISDHLAHSMSSGLARISCRRISCFVWVLLQRGSYSEFNFITCPS